MNPIEKYHERFFEIKSEKGIRPDSDSIQQLINKDISGLNNFFMAGLGMGTMILRMGAVIQLCGKFESL